MPYEHVHVRHEHEHFHVRQMRNELMQSDLRVCECQWIPVGELTGSRRE